MNESVRRKANLAKRVMMDWLVDHALAGILRSLVIRQLAEYISGRHLV